MALTIRPKRDLLDLHDVLARELAFGEPDWTAAAAYRFEVMALAETCDYPWDLKRGWFTQSRWNSLVRQYIDPKAYEHFLHMCDVANNKTGHAFLRTNTVEGRAGKRQWGSCMVGVGFRYQGKKPTLVLHSRTTYIGYIGYLDLALVHCIARDVAEICGLTTSDISFAWYLESAQFHGFRSLAWWFDGDEYRSEYLSKPKGVHRNGHYLATTQFKRLERYDSEGQLYGDMSYMSQCRMRKRYHTEVLGKEYAEQFSGGERYTGSNARAFAPLPSLPVSSLVFPTTSRKVQEGPDGGGQVADLDEMEEAGLDV